MSTSTADELVEQLADHRLDWQRIERQISRALDDEGREADPHRHMGPYVTVSRQAGIDAAAFADRLGEALDWPVLDSEIVDLIAATFKLDSATLHLLDEARANWVREVLGDLMPHQVVNFDTYVHHLGKILRLVALHGDVVLVGRGAQLFLPRSRGLAVRLVAPEEERLRRLMAHEGVDEAEARRRMTEIDDRRANFLEHYFGRHVEDATLYDLVLNSSTLSEDEMLEAVLAACHQRGYDD